MNAATEDDFYALFKKTKGRNLSQVIQACMTVIASPHQEGYARADRVRKVLKRIAGESKINAIRIKKKYEIEPDHPNVIEIG